MASLLAIYREKQILRKLQSSLIFEFDKVDLTAEIKISEHVISLLGALYMESDMRLTNVTLSEYRPSGAPAPNRVIDTNENPYSCRSRWRLRFSD